MKYRSEIDGLRAVAVLPVMLFHAGFESFSGGFVGVDVFFVISGYLITSIILAELDRGSFSLANFYERRSRRIIPALFTVLACCIPVAWIALEPTALQNFAEGLVAVVAFYSNILFWLRTGYFESAAELNPLLHTWSLAVEEQFYIFFPLLLMVTWRLGRRTVVVGIALVALASFLAAEWGSRNAPSATFFLLPTRAWELALGALAAFRLAGEPRGLRAPIAGGLALAGIALILVSVFAYDEGTPFPGVFALAPTLGTLLVVLHARPDNMAGALLGQRVLVGLGLVSYSAYLWHQPLFAFARHLSLGEPSTGTMLALFVLAFALAWITWRLVEQPFRQKGRVSRRRIFSFAVVGSLALVCLATFGIRLFPQPDLLPVSVTATLQRSPRITECFDRRLVHKAKDWLCPLGKLEAPPAFVLFGDSHAASLIEVFDESARGLGQAGVVTGASGCPPLLGVHALRHDQAERDCHRLNERMFEYVAEQKIAKLFLAGRWSYYTDGGYGGTDMSHLGFAPDDPRDKENSRRAFRHGVEETLSRYRALGVKVYIVEQVPEQRFEPAQIYRHAYSGGRVDVADLQANSVPRAEHDRLQTYVTGIFAGHAGEFTPVPTVPLLCGVESCPVGDAQVSRYFDNDHLSLEGARRLSGVLKPLLR